MLSGHRHITRDTAVLPRRLLVVLATLCALLSPQSVAARQVSGEVRGRVLDATDRTPVAGARVELDGAAVHQRSGADGTFVLRSLEPRSYRLRVQALGFRTTVVEVIVANARVADVEVLLPRAALVLAAQQVVGMRDTASLSATSIDRADIERSGARDVADVLQAVPGVVVTRAGGPGQPSRVSIRGSTAGQVLVLLDGVPVNSALGGAADLSLLPIEQVERVTVLTGAQSARYGPRAMAGVVEVVTRRPRHEQSLLLRGGALGEWGGALSFARRVEGRTLSEAGVVDGSAARRGVSRQLSLGVDHRDVQGDFRFTLPAVRGGGWARRENAAVTSTQVVAGASLEGTRHQLALRGNFGHTRRGLAGSVVQPSLTGAQRFLRSAAGLSTTHTLGLWSLSSTLDVARERARFADNAPPFGQPYADTISATTTALTAQAVRSWRGVTTTLGVDARQLGVRASRLSGAAPRTQELLGAWMSVRHERTWPTSAWRLQSDAALRVDHSSLIASDAWSPRVAARLMHPMGGGTAFASASYGAGFAPPTLADQFFHEGVQVRANASLRPERSRHDAELRLGLRELPRFGVVFHGEAAAYRADIDGMILWLPDFRFVWSPSNYDVRRRGWETRAGVRIPAWHVDLSGAVEENAVSYAGPVLTGQVAYRPQHTAHVQLGATWGGTRAEVVTRHVGVRRVIAGSNLNALPAYRMSDLRVSTRQEWRGRWTLQPTLAVENLFSRQAAMLVDYPFPTRLWSLSLRLRPASATATLP